MKSNTQYFKTRSTVFVFATRTTSTTRLLPLALVLVLSLVLAGFSCEPLSLAFQKTIKPPTAAGPPTNLSFDEVQPNDVVLAWNPPAYTGTKIGGILLQAGELVYQIYYLKGTIDDETPTAEEIKNLATSSDSAQRVGTKRGSTRIQITDLESGSRYFLTAETYNSFASESALSSEVIETVIPTHFTGNLTYAETEHELKVRDSAVTISPDTVPVITTGEESIRYGLEKIEGDLPDTDLSDTVISIDEESGAITINPTTTGTARFVVRAEATGHLLQEIFFTVRILPRVAGAVTGLEIESTSVENHSFGVRWTAPAELGTRQSGTKLEPEELVYRVYYLAANAGGAGDDTLPEARVLVQEARVRLQIEQVQGSTNVRLVDLRAGTLYFVAVETYNAFTNVSTLSEDVVKAMSTTDTKDFSGTLAYGQEKYSYPVVSSEATIIPSMRPKATESIEYGLNRRDGVQFSSTTVVIDVTTGVITVDPSATTVAGVTGYRVFARAAGSNTQYVEITIHITQIEIEVTPYYSQEAEVVIPVPIGQAIRDDSLADDEVVLSIESSEYSSEYTVHLDTGSGVSSSRGASFAKTPNAANRITIQKSELRDHRLSRADGAVIGLSGPGLAGIQEVAIYRPREIRSWQDLQAMRVNLRANYVLKNDIVFPDTAEGTSNFEPVGTREISQGASLVTPYALFKGSLDGTNGAGSFYIKGMQIESAAKQVGLFGAADGGNTKKVIAKNLVFIDCTITGQDRVGTLVGYLSEGTVKNVGVELSSPGAGKVGGFLGRNTGRDMGGLVGFSYRSKVEGYVKVPVTGYSNVGGLVGENNTGSVVLGYSTGDVSGVDTVGGLVGLNLSDSATSVVGYSTGDVTGDYSVGGLVGFAVNEQGRIKGYSTGDVSGVNTVGGLVGRIQDEENHYSRMNITGYSTGDVTGADNVGGMVGLLDVATVVGYSRSNVYRSSGDSVRFGKTVGHLFQLSWANPIAIEETEESVRKKTYSSLRSNPSESQLRNMDGTNIAETTTGEHGNPVNIDGASSATLSRELFSELFGLEAGTDWTWVGSGKWPALDLGDIISPSDQPID